MKRYTAVAILGVLSLALTAGAQTRPSATFADFGRWESMSTAGARGGLSPDGRWLAYTISRSNRDNELRLARIADGETTVIASGERPVYSADSKWLAYSIGYSEAEQERLRREQKPVQNRLGLRDLATGETVTFDTIESFTFSPDGAFLAMTLYAPSRAASAGGRAGGADASESAPGKTLIIRRLADGRETALGNIAQSAWQDLDSAHLLALIISAEGKAGNGIQLFDPATGVLRVLDSSASDYTDLVWRKDTADLAVLRARTAEGKDGPSHDVLAWTGLGSRSERRRTYEPSSDPAFPAGLRIVSYRRLAWSADGRTLFLGVAPWDDVIAPSAPARRGGEPVARPAQGGDVAGRGGAASADEPSSVEIWHSKDVFVMPLQKTRANSDRRRNMLAVWHLESGRFVQIGLDPVNEEVTPIRGRDLAVVAEWADYAMNRTIGRPAADLYLADLTTGARSKVADGINDRYVQTSPGGKYLMFRRDDHFWTVDLTSRVVRNITESAPVSFIDLESDQTSPDEPPFGIAGWTRDEKAVLFYDRYDLWRVEADGSKVERLTAGSEEEIRHRLVRPDQERGGRFSGPSAADEGIDLSKPVYLSLYGEWTKQSGYARLDPRRGLTRLVWLDRSVDGLARAKNAEVYGYVVQDYDDSPDVFVGGPELKDARQVTKTNPFQEEFAWGRSELVDYVTEKGRRLQGALFYPAGYEPGKTYPMIVYTYELLSQGVHRYVVPSDRSYYNISVFTSLGYFVLEPDIVFRERQPGWSVVECVTAGVKKVLTMGLVDPARVGIVGHSMGGFNSAFIATNTDGIFAAAVAGAPIIDMVSYYADHHWSSGIAETDHIETGQERMVVPLYEDLQAYIDNSPYFNAHNMTVPLLLEVGDQDGTVAWHQGIELYNVARRANRNVVMLAYMGEDHGLRRVPNQRDYQQRILAWFGHYLKGEPAERWITDGQSYLDRQVEIKRQGRDR